MRLFESTRLRLIQDASPLIKFMEESSPYRRMNHQDYAYFLYEDTISFLGGGGSYSEYHGLLAGALRRFETEHMLRRDLMASAIRDIR